MYKLLTPEIKRKIEGAVLNRLSNQSPELVESKKREFDRALNNAIEDLGFRKPFSPKNTPEFQAELEEFFRDMFDRTVEFSAFIDDTRYRQETSDFWRSELGNIEANIALIDALIKKFGILVRCEFYLKGNIVEALEKLKANKHLKRLGLTKVLTNEDAPEKDYGC